MRVLKFQTFVKQKLSLIVQNEEHMHETHIFIQGYFPPPLGT